jgi:predicted O-methyltransferase YrrM
MRNFLGRILGFESPLLQLETRIAVLVQQEITHQALLAVRDAQVREAQSFVREREATVRERESVVREREATIELLKAFPPNTDTGTWQGGAWQGITPIAQSDDLEATILAVLPQLDGWCTPRKALWLAGLIQNNNIRRIGEIGVYGGRSLIPMALAARGVPGASVYAIEPWDNSVAVEHATDAGNDQWWREVDLGMIKQKFITAVLSYGLSEIMKIVELPSNDARTAFTAAAKFDLLHIDGSHAEPQALADVMDWLPLVAPGGIIVLDDIGWTSVGKARDYLRAQCTIIEEVEEEDKCSYGAYRAPGAKQAAYTAAQQHEMA